MGATATVNGRTVVHKASGGVTFAFPDVCLTPPAPTPVPYPNFAFSADAAGTAASIFADAQPIMLRDSTFGRSFGDEPGTGGGLVSGVFSAAAKFINYSFDVKGEGQEVPRLFDPMIQNASGVPNAVGPAEAQPNVQAEKAKELICAAVCACWESGQNSDCVATAMADIKQGPDGRYYDPKDPNIFVEQGFRMSKPPETKPPEAITGGNTDRFGRPASPYRVYPPGSRRPDFVVTNDGQVPRSGPDSNIAKVFDVKFPGDRFRDGQEAAYTKIANGDPPEELTPDSDSCACDGEKRKRSLAHQALLKALIAMGIWAAQAGKAAGQAVEGLAGGFAPVFIGIERILKQGRGGGEES